VTRAVGSQAGAPLAAPAGLAAPSGRPGRIDQVVPSFAGRDAIGVHVLHVRDTLRAAGYASDIWAMDVLPDMRRQARPLTELPTRTMPATWLLFHHSIGTPVVDLLCDRAEPLIVDYHNVTPAALVDRWEPALHAELVLGRDQLAPLAARAFFALADSAYNEQELRASGFRHTDVVPPLFALESFEVDVDEHVLERLRDGPRARQGTHWLFVGRLAPHKAPHELVKALACYRRLYDPEAVLHLVGNPLGTTYPRALARYVQRLGLADAVEITGSIGAGELAAYYRAADVFVCASAHEGFCVPVVEAMHLGVPVVAQAAAAVPETVDGGGVVLDDRSPLALAVAVHRVLGDEDVRRRLIRAGRHRAASFALGRSRARLLAALERAVTVAGGAARPAASVGEDGDGAPLPAGTLGDGRAGR